MALSSRCLEPEWLDHLAPSDPRAVRSRRDLALINALMRSAPLIARYLRGSRIADLGAGDGRVALSIARRSRGHAHVTLVDRAPAVSAATLEQLREAGWQPAVAADDVFVFLERTTLDALYANLFLHHFDDAALERLLALIAARCRLFVACEPRRSRASLLGARLLGLLGCNDVTRHDAAVSVRAGFAGGELSRLWPRAPGWTLVEKRGGLFGHLFVAARDA